MLKSPNYVMEIVKIEKELEARNVFVTSQKY